MKPLKALCKQLFGAKYQAAGKNLLAAAMLFFAIHATGLKLVVAPLILYLTSTFFTAGVMWQTLTGRQHLQRLQGLFMLPFENRSLVFGYVAVLGAHTLLTKTLYLWALFFSAAAWSGFEVAAALLCGCMSCAVTSAVYVMLKKGIALPIFWAACNVAAFFIARRTAAVANMAVAALYLYFANAYEFYSTSSAKKTARYAGSTANVFAYLARCLLANKNYCVNTAGLCAVACFLPLLLSEFQGLNVVPIGLAILCLNTPICTLLSCDPGLEQAIRVLPGQAAYFCRRYCLFVFAVNASVAGIYLCSWQFINGGIGAADVAAALVFALQSAVLSVVLEWVCPIRGWKIESDLWHHPRKYLVPLVMLLLAAVIGTWSFAIWYLCAALPVECCVLPGLTRH